MKNSKKLVPGKKPIAITASALSAILAAGLIIYICTKKVQVAFYSLEESHIECIKKELSEIKKLNFVTLNDSKPLAEQIKKIDLVFCPMGKNSSETALEIYKKRKTKPFFNKNDLKGSSMSAAASAGITEGKVSQVPVLFDVYEMLIDTKTTNRTRTKKIESWLNIENFLKKAKKENLTASPILFAGKDNDVLLGIVSLLLESFEGSEIYNTTVQKIADTKRAKYDEVIKELSDTPEKPMYETIHRIAQWKKDGLLSTETFRLEFKDIESFMTYHNGGVIFMPLSDHRLINHRTIQSYSTLPVFSEESLPYVPSAKPLGTRAIVSSIICAVPVTGKKKVKDCVRHLLKTPQQENLAGATGLAPFLANCKTPDIQSDDARFWIAATTKPVINIGEAAFTTEKNKKAFCKALVEYINNVNVN